MVAGVLSPAVALASAADITSAPTVEATAASGPDCSAAVSGSALGRTGWVASTNAPSPSAGSPANALDGKMTTRFSSDKAQAAGLYFKVDLGSAQSFDELDMNVAGSPTDYARGYTVEVSADDSSWATVASCSGSTTPEIVSFPTQTARYLIVVLTAPSTAWWSIDELNVYGGSCSGPASGPALDRTSWVASTNAPSTSADSPANALDGNLTTRFSSDKDQAPGLYFEADLGSATSFDALAMGTPNSSSDYARGYEVEVSTDDMSWATVASCAGTATPEIVNFPVQKARYVRVVLAATANQSWSIDELNLYDGPVITSAASQNVVSGLLNSLTITTTGAPVPVVTEAGALPPGLNFSAHNDGTATIAGTPPAGARGTYEVSITATNGDGSPVVQHLVLTLVTPPVITSAPGWRALPGQYNSFTVTTTGSPAPALTLSGALPTGLSFKDNGNGTATISGTPAAGARGSYTLTITANNGARTPAVQNFALTLGDAPVITSSSSWSVALGRYNAFTITTTGSPAPALTESGSLPPGLTFRANNNGTATISGTPPSGSRGAYEVTITATNGVGSPAVQDLAITLGGAPVITSTSAWRVLPGQYNAFTVTTTGSPVPALSLSGHLPAGMAFRDNGNGTAIISGTPPSNVGRGTYEVTITATNGVGGPAVQYLSLTVAGAPLIVSASGWRVLPGVNNVFTVIATGSPIPVLRLSGGTLPPGLVFKATLSGTATISGTPPASTKGTYEVAITASNGVGAPALQYLVMTLGGSRTTTSLSASANPVPVGQAVTYTAKVVPTPNGGVVNFFANSATIAGCTQRPVNTATGDATCSTTYASTGARSVQASYSGDAAFGPSTSGAYAEVVNLPAQGYWLATANGEVYGVGAAQSLGNAGTSATTGRVEGIVGTPDAKGYWAVTANGTVSAFGDARFYGDLPALGKHVSDVVAIAPTSDGKGYYLVGADGGFFTFGDAKFHGSLPGIHVHAKDIVGVVTAPGGQGYLLVGADGGVFTFGSTRFYGSLPGTGKHVHDIRAILPSSTGKGYILVGADGGVFNFGSGAKFHGSLPGEGVKVSNIVGIALTPDDGGYYMAGTAGRVYAFGDARAFAEPAALPANLPVAAIAGT
jgi:hypothetical protein